MKTGKRSYGQNLSEHEGKWEMEPAFHMGHGLKNSAITRRMLDSQLTQVQPAFVAKLTTSQ